jgi:hypothetical protein
MPPLAEQLATSLLLSYHGPGSPWGSSGCKLVGLPPESVLRGMLGTYPTHGDPLLTFRHPFQASSAARITATLRFEPHLILGVVHLPLLASPWPRLVEHPSSPSEWCVRERSDVGVTYAAASIPS